MKLLPTLRAMSVYSRSPGPAMGMAGNCQRCDSIGLVIYEPEVSNMLYLQIHQGDLSHPVGVLEEYFRKAGTSIIRAAFSHSYFIHPDDVKEKTPYFA